MNELFVDLFQLLVNFVAFVVNLAGIFGNFVVLFSRVDEPDLAKY